MRAPSKSKVKKEKLWGSPWVICRSQKETDVLDEHPRIVSSFYHGDLVVTFSKFQLSQTCTSCMTTVKFPTFFRLSSACHLRIPPNQKKKKDFGQLNKSAVQLCENVNAHLNQNKPTSSSYVYRDLFGSEVNSWVWKYLNFRKRIVNEISIRE